MKERENRNKPSTIATATSEKALARFAKKKPKEFAETLAAEVLQKKKSMERRIQDTKKEIEDGARPRKGRFSL